MILCIKADSSEVYLGMWDNDKEITGKTWQTGRELSVQILSVINDLCEDVSITLEQITGIVVYEGPGSYTGLRISISVANALAYSSQIPIIGSTGDDWIKLGLSKLNEINKYTPITPKYGGEVYTTKPIK